MEIVVFTPN